MTFEELYELLETLERVEGSAASIGAPSEFAAQARALEFGSVVGQRPWPQAGERTVIAMDPESGAQVVVSAQAPQGFLRPHSAQFAKALRDALTQPADWLNAHEAREHIARATLDAAGRALEAMRTAVPRASGELAHALHIIE